VNPVFVKEILLRKVKAHLVPLSGNKFVKHTAGVYMKIRGDHHDLSE
jgi:hypothetical protein